ncbi:MAG: hypothetical protein WCX46_04560 [Candidatus Paceibacterota bacterium]
METKELKCDNCNKVTTHTEQSFSIGFITRYRKAIDYIYACNICKKIQKVREETTNEKVEIWD